MGGEWTFEINNTVEINFKEYCMFLIDMYDKMRQTQNTSVVEYWNKEQYDLIKKNLEQCHEKTDLSFDKLFDSDYSKPFFSIMYKQYRFVMYLDPNKTEGCLHARGIENFFFKKKVLSIQRTAEKKFVDKFSNFIPDGINGYLF
jgi:hypothetical protein